MLSATHPKEVQAGKRDATHHPFLDQYISCCWIRLLCLWGSGIDNNNFEYPRPDLDSAKIINIADMIILTRNNYDMR